MSEKRRRVCILVDSAVYNDPRVRKQCRALSESGRYDVHVVGLAAGQGIPSEPESWPRVSVELLPLEPPKRGAARISEIGGRLAAGALRSRAIAEATYRGLLHVDAFRERARAAAADLYWANDWFVLPVAVEVARERGAKVVYDAHEMWTRAYPDLRFRVLRAPFIGKIESLHAPRADHVVSVSDTITRALVALHGLDPARASTIRNAAEAREVRRRALDPGAVRVLYHGRAEALRGLETLVDSVPLWEPRFSLALRVVGDTDYVASLQRRAAERAPGRIAFLEPLPVARLVDAAADFDVGVHSITDLSWNGVACLPNKVFEYAMAGLALCTSDLPEMRGVIERHGLGVVFAARDPRALARALNAMSAEDIARYQANALRFSREVNAGTEFAAVTRTCDRLLGAGEPPSGGAA